MNRTTNWAPLFILLSNLFAGAYASASSSEELAVKSATQAFIIQSGIDDMVKGYITKKVSPANQEAVAKALQLVKIVETRRIEFEWKF